MPRQNTIKTNFTAGEVSPKIYGRIDAKVYENGAKSIHNMLVLPQGGVTRRSGSGKVHATKFATTSSSYVRLVEWEYSDTEATVLEVGDGYIRFHQNGHRVYSQTNYMHDINRANNGGLMQIRADNPIVDSPTFTITDVANNGGLYQITTSTNHTLRTGTRVRIEGTGTTADTNPAGGWTVTRLTDTTFLLQASTFGGTAATGTVHTHGLLAGDEIWLYGGTGDLMTLLNGYHIIYTVDSYYEVTLANVPHQSGSFGSEYMTPIPVEVTSPYTAAQLSELRFIQSADTLYILHPDVAPRKLVRTAVAGLGSFFTYTWTLSTVSFTDGPYLSLNDDAPALNSNDTSAGTQFVDTYMDVTGYTHTATVRCSPLVATLSDSGGNYLVTTAVPHGLASTNLVVIAGTGTTADGNRIATVVSTTTFTIGVAFGSVGTAGTATPAFATGDDSRYIEYRENDQWRLAQLPSTMSDYDVTATVTIIDNVLLHLDETTKFKNTIRRRVGPFESVTTYNAGSPNASPSVPMAGVRQRVDPNNLLRSGQSDALAGTLTSNYNNTFGPADLGKYVRYFDNTAFGAAASRIVRWAQITRISDSPAATTGGSQASHSAAVTMATINSAGGFVISSHSRTGTVTSRRNGSASAIFASTDAGRHIRLGWAGRWTWGIISAYTSTSVVSVTFYEDVPRDPHNAANLAGALTGGVTVASSLVTGLASGRTYDWRLGAWSGTTGYPSTGCFHEQRLCLGRTDTQPQTFWGSITGDFENMRPTELDSTVLDDNAITFTLASGRVNAIKWMESGTNLVIGTNGGEWLARSSAATQEPITPSNITVTQQSRNGSGRLAQPLRIGSSIVFVNRSEQKVMDVSYLFSEDRLQDKDLTIVAEHILRQSGTVVQCAFQQNPHMIGWFVMSDGTLNALTYNQEQEVIAWHRHTITNGSVESIAIIPNSTGTEDSIYLLVKRTISAADYRTVELFAPQFYSNTASPTTRLNMRFMDGYVAGTNNSSASTITSLTGLFHLEGKSVIVTSAGTKVGTSYTVTSGAITPSTAIAVGAEYVVGLAFTPSVDSLPLEGGSRNGVSQGMKKELKELKVRVYDTCEYSVAMLDRTSDLETKTLSTAAVQFATSIDNVLPKADAGIDLAWRITSSNPYALTVLAVTQVLETHE